MLIKVMVGSKHDSQKLEVLGKGNLSASNVYTSYMAKRRVTLGVPRRMVSDFSGFRLGRYRRTMSKGT